MTLVKNNCTLYSRKKIKSKSYIHFVGNKEEPETLLNLNLNFEP